ncbi:MerR family transcriptional regulator [Kineococcus rhizosphaerae]|uniref:DNA-binding transcriptional MerR regulator n=1 Tax=Kineococcus rhizosphaerae TaxID=559628 RepID=A0A2T0R813_9ACTN|nr:MerR family transcriptional regulator [Kineococcus rhizosphaerae]PRY17309.1 DNA-binding transcriptional MerR regulator [Kineococcus rhizosphaerae]
MEQRFGIGEVSDLTGIGVDALRFYEREGLMVEPVHRDSAGRRSFSPAEVEWLRMCATFRTTGMPLSDIARYAALVRAGEGNEAERLDLLAGHQRRVEQQLADLAGARDTIAFKVDLYRARLAEGTAAQLWTGQPPDCTPAPAAHDEVA